MLKGRVSATFPKAFLKQLKREKSPISNLLDCLLYTSDAADD